MNRNDRLRHRIDREGPFIGFLPRGESMWWLAYMTEGHVVLVLRDKRDYNIGQIRVFFDPGKEPHLSLPYSLGSLEEYMKR